MNLNRRLEGFRYPGTVPEFLVRQQGWDITYNLTMIIRVHCTSLDFLGGIYEFFPKCLLEVNPNHPPFLYAALGHKVIDWQLAALQDFVQNGVELCERLNHYHWPTVKTLPLKKLDETGHEETGNIAVAGPCWVMNPSYEEKRLRSWPVSLIRRVVCAHLGSNALGKQKSHPSHPSMIVVVNGLLMDIPTIATSFKQKTTQKSEVPTLLRPRHQTNVHSQIPRAPRCFHLYRSRPSHSSPGYRRTLQPHDSPKGAWARYVPHNPLHPQKQTWSYGTLEKWKKKHGKWFPFSNAGDVQVPSKF